LASLPAMSTQAMPPADSAARSRASNARAVAQEAIGLPRQVRRAQQRQLAAPLEGQRIRQQRVVVEVVLAAQRRDQRRRVADDEFMPAGRGFDARGLLGGDMGLLMPLRRAAVRVAPFAQVFRHQAGVEFHRQRFGQRGLAGAFGAEQRDDHACLHARQPMTLNGMKPA
jgi:hypothetical protein